MIYTILKNCHYSIHLPKIYLGKRTEFDVNFSLDKDCAYTFNDVDQDDVDKLFGVCFGWNDHKNSVRIGWRYKDGAFKLFSYSYNDSKRSIFLLHDFPADTTVYMKMIFDFKNNQVLFIREGYITFKLNYDFPKCKIGYYLYPYFGGNKKAPHKMNVSLKF